MQVVIDPAELRPVIEAAVSETIAKLAEEQAHVGDKIAFSEVEAARLLDIEPHVMRDARLRGEITASRITGRRIRYLRADLLDYMQRTRITRD